MHCRVCIDAGKKWYTGIHKRFSIFTISRLVNTKSPAKIHYVSHFTLFNCFVLIPGTHLYTADDLGMSNIVSCIENRVIELSNSKYCLKEVIFQTYIEIEKFYWKNLMAK